MIAFLCMFIAQMYQLLQIPYCTFHSVHFCLSLHVSLRLSFQFAEGLVLRVIGGLGSGVGQAVRHIMFDLHDGKQVV